MQKPKETSANTEDLVKTTSKFTDAITVCVPSVSVSSRSICIKASDGFHLVSNKVSNMFPVSTRGGCIVCVLTDAVLMWFHAGSMAN